ncbi:tetrahydromethanopterin synthesis protein, partial [Methylococcaceae bacterium HT4]
YEWPLKKAKKIDGHFLEGTLAHCEVKLTHVDDDPVRPKLFCQSVHRVNHSAFKGFNRAQLSVLEAAILLSRINRLSSAKIHTELEYLHIGFNKTAGPKEREAWDWITKAIEQKLREL